MKKIAFAFFATVALAHAESSPVPSPSAPAGETYARATATCRDARGKTLTLTLRGTTAEADSEERAFGSAILRLEGAKPTKVPFRSTELRFFEGRGKSACGKVLGFVSPVGTLFVPVRVNNRPFSDRLGIAAFDPSAETILGTWESDDSIRESETFQIESVPDGIRYRAWNARTDVGGENVRIRGHDVEAVEVDFVYWRRIAGKAGELEASIDAARTYATSEFKPYFKRQADFDSAFGLLADGSRYANTSLVFVARPGKWTCIQPTADRKPKTGDAHWICLP